MEVSKKWVLSISTLLAGMLLLTACALPESQPAPIQTVLPTQVATQTSTQPAATAPMETVPEIDLNANRLEEIYEDLFLSGGSLDLSLHFQDGSSDGPYALLNMDSDLITPLSSLTEVPNPDRSACTEWIVLEPSNGAFRITIYCGAPGGDLISYEENGGSRCYRQSNIGYYTVGEYQRSIFDRLEYNALGRISFASENTGAELLEEYVKTVYPQHLQQLSPGNMYRYSDYEALCWTVLGTRENAVLGQISYAAIPGSRTPVNTGWEESPGTGEYEGWQIYKKAIALERHQDGFWYEISADDYIIANQGGGSRQAVFPVDPSAPETQEALEYLAQAEVEFTKRQELGSDGEILRALAELFLRCNTAARISGSADFDWSVFCTQEALEYTGVRSMAAGAAKQCRDHLNCDLHWPFTLEQIQIDGDHAAVFISGLRLYFVREDGRWRICDIVDPYANPQREAGGG